MSGGNNQQTIAECFTRGAKTGLNEYPLLYVPKPSDIPSSELAAFERNRICHGYYDSFLYISGIPYDLSKVRLGLNPGKDWYSDPHYKRTIQSSTRQTINIHGTFRHMECTNMNCCKCGLISGFQDFRKRVIRACVAQKRKSEGDYLGITFENLKRDGLLSSLHKWKGRAKLASNQLYLLNVDLARAKKSSNYLLQKTKSIMEEGSLPEIAELFRRVANTGALDQRACLYMFIKDLAQNLLTVHKNGGDGRGKRYHRSTLKLFEILHNYGGRAAHNFFSSNLVGPTLHTNLTSFRSDGFIYVLGLNEEAFKHIASILIKCKKRLGINGPIPFECSEDETKCIQVATWNRRLDTIDGFCGLKGSEGINHKCSFNSSPSAQSFDLIKTTFETHDVGSMCRVLIANPLVKGMPRLVYAIMSTCNRFDHTQVGEQWEVIRRFHKKHLEPAVGPLCGHASDEDARRRKLMLESIGRGSYGLKTEGFLMLGEVVDGRPMIMIQDTYHIGKKLRNQILAPNRELFWGKHVAHKNHLLRVVELFDKSEHGLLIEDVNVKDKQNVPAVQRIAFPKVRACLEKLDAGMTLNGVHVQEHVRGTIIHLEVLWAFLELFFGRGSLLERVKLASFVVHMLYLGSSYIREKGHGHTIAENWMTRESQLDCLIACHSSVLHMQMMKEFFPHLPIALERSGSDCCEDFFSMLGQQVLNKHNFSAGEAASRTSYISRSEQIKKEENGLVFVGPRRRKNFWWLGNAQTCVVDDIGEYEYFTDAAIKVAWSSGLDLAHARADYVGMKETLLKSEKWLTPWPSSFSHTISLADECALQDCEDVEVQLAEAATLEVQSTAVNLEGINTLLDESLICVSSLNQGLEQEFSEVGCITPDSSSISSMVDIPGKGLVYKMRVMTELNLAPSEKLPLDRLRRVQYHGLMENLLTSTDGPELGLFDDVAMLFEDNKQIVCYLGRVQKLVKIVGENSKVDYVRAVPLSSKNIKILPKYYKHISGLRYTYGGFDGQERDMVSIDSVICLVSLTYDVQSGDYILAESDKITLDTFVKNETKRRGACKKSNRPLQISSSEFTSPSSCRKRKQQTSRLPLEKAMTSKQVHVRKSGRAATRSCNIR